MRQPITFAWGNVVFGRSMDDAWAVYHVATEAYVGLTTAAKRDVMSSLAGFAFTVGRDFQLLRVTRAWSAGSYRAAASTCIDQRFAHGAGLDEHLSLHEQHLSESRTARPEVFLAISLGARRWTWPGLTRLFAGVAASLGLTDPVGITATQLERLQAEERVALAAASDFLSCDRATTDELQWLIRRGFVRSIAEPDIDRLWCPQALVVDGDETEGARFIPLEADVVRLSDAAIEVAARQLTIESEGGFSHQAFLSLGALPEVVMFPSHQAELLFSPLEALPFEIDAAVSVRWIANDEAVALARRKLVDADNTFDEEAHGDHGPTSAAAARPSTARELEELLAAPDRPPLLRTSVSLCVAAPDAEQLEERVRAVRHEYAPIVLHRPLGVQLDLFVSHLPGQLCSLRAYDDLLVCEQLGAMVPTATHAVGSPVGMYIGHALSGSAQPVVFDLTEAPRTARPAAVLCSGTLGSGKTLTAELLAYQAYLAGSRIVSVDPKGDHRLHDLVRDEDVETIELGASEADQGRLDPLRIAPPDTRADLAYSFLLDVLPSPIPPAWQTEIRDAVNVASAAGARGCGDVVAILDVGRADAREAGRAIGVHARSGLLRLGFAESDVSQDAAGSKQVTLLRIANLALPLPGTPRTEMTNDERAGQAVLRLLASYALHLMGRDWSRHKVLLFDEAWMLLGDAAGRALVQRINRLCRSQNATPILATQALADVAEMENLIGACFCFGVETEAEAARALALLRMDADDPRLRAQLQGFRRGRCFMRDYEGRVAPILIDLVDEDLLRALDTTPGRVNAA